MRTVYQKLSSVEAEIVGLVGTLQSMFCFREEGSLRKILERVPFSISFSSHTYLSFFTGIP